MSIDPSKKIDKFRAKRILEVGETREITFDEDLQGLSGKVVSISAKDLGKIMKVPFNSKDHTVFLDNLNNVMRETKSDSLLSSPVSLTDRNITDLHFLFKEDAFQEIVKGSKRSK